MSSTATKRKPGHGRNHWTHEQRLCLDVLSNGPYASLSDKQRGQAFNAIFADHLASYLGQPGGLSPNAIRQQYHERTKTHKTTWKATWERVCATPYQDVELREELRGRIESVLEWDGEDDVIRVVTPATTLATPVLQRQRNEGGGSNGYATPEPSTRRPAAPPTTYATPGPSTRKQPAAVPFTIVNAEFSDDTEDELLSSSVGRRTFQPVLDSPGTPRPSTRRHFSTSYATPGPSTRRSHTATFGSALDSYVHDDNEDQTSSPLDRRAASKALSSFRNTPRPNVRKRPNTIATPLSAVQADNDSDAEYLPISNKRQKATSPTVIIPPSPESIMRIRQIAPNVPAQSPRSKKRPRDASGRREGANCRTVRRQGPDLWLYEAEFAEWQLPLVDVTEEAAHPNPPALLYRYWSATSHGR